MEMIFDSIKIEDEYFDNRYIQRKYGPIFAKNLEKMLGAIIDAENAYEIYVLPMYKMHLLEHDLAGIYSLSPDNKKSRWRVPVICLNDNDKPWFPTKGRAERYVLEQTKKFNVKEITDYHD